MIQEILRTAIKKVRTNTEYRQAIKELGIEDIYVYVIDDDKRILRLKVRDATYYSICRIHDSYLKAFISRLKGDYK